MTSSKSSIWCFRAGTIVFLGISFVLIGITLAAPAQADGEDPEDEIVFYRDDGLYRYYDIKPDGTLPAPLNGGSGYTSGWDSIVGVDVDGGGQDEIFFYREDGLYVYYDIRADGSLGSPIFGDDGYTKGWSSIVAVDLDADGKDEMFFYREDGLYAFYDVKPNGRLGEKLSSGTGYTKGWSSIVGVDLDGGGQDEMFFYRDDGLYAYYEVRASGALAEKLSSGTGYTKDWSSIVGLDLDGDRQDEMLFYRDDGLYAYYDVRSDGTLGPKINEGDGYSDGWSVISAIQLHGDLPAERISRFTTYFDCCQNRVTNIRQIAREINGTVVMPGETFSVDDVTGPRTSAGGYLPAPYLQNGQGQCCAVGGGVSQFGTTIHNAVFWGGLDVVDHRPHTGWISRYPLGIEATLVYRSIDYKFTNDTATPITIRTSSTSTSVTVELWGNQGGWQVSGYHPRGSRNPRISVLDHGGADAKRVRGVVYGSAPGTVRIVRTLTENGVSTSEAWWWNYVS